MSKYLLVFIFGAIAPLAFQPFNYEVILFICYGVLFWAISISSNKKQAFYYGFVFAFSHYLIGLYWLFSIANQYEFVYQIIIIIILLGIIAAIAFFYGLIGFFAKTLPSKHWSYLILFLPSIASLSEWVRTWFWTGFPWYSPSDAIFDLGLSPLLPVSGYLGVSFVFYILSGMLVYLIIHYKKAKTYKILLSSFTIIVVLTFILKPLSWTESLPSFKARLISGNFNLIDKANRHLIIERFKQYRQLTETKPMADLTLWPESSISIDYQDIEAHIDKKPFANTVMLGGYYNTGVSSNNVLFDFNKQQPVYYKQHLIPFGEYTPRWFVTFKSLLPKFHMSEIITRENKDRYIDFNNLKLFTSICFELLFSEELIRSSKHANTHLHISDLGWFNNHLASSYLLDVARIRAIETSKPIIYSVNQGISAFIDHKGNILKKQDRSGTYILNQIVAPQQGSTFYVKFGNKPILIFIILLLCFAILFSGLKRSKKHLR